MGYSLGIDLGTTFTAAAIDRVGTVEMAPLGDRAATIPSVVLVRSDGPVLTGDAANRRAMMEPDRVAREFKRRLGDPTPLVLGGAPHSVTSVLARLLGAVVGRVAEREGGPAEHVMLTYPANWGPYKRELFGSVPRIAEVEHVSMTTEPEAAAAHYAMSERLADGAVIAVYDFGGGTFDATVLRRRGPGFEILGVPEGVEGLGGIDFDEAVFAFVDRTLDGAVTALDYGDRRNAAALLRLRQECVLAKETLSADTETIIPVLLPGVQGEVRLTRAELEEMMRPSIESTVGALRRALRSARVAPEDLDAVLLVGGSSRIPLVSQMVSEALGRPTAVDAHPKYVVALGAAALARRAGGSAPANGGPPVRAGRQGGAGVPRPSPPVSLPPSPPESALSASAGGGSAPPAPAGFGSGPPASGTPATAAHGSGSPASPPPASASPASSAPGPVLPASAAPGSAPPAPAASGSAPPAPAASGSAPPTPAASGSGPPAPPPSPPAASPLPSSSSSPPPRSTTSRTPPPAYPGGGVRDRADAGAAGGGASTPPPGPPPLTGADDGRPRQARLRMLLVAAAVLVVLIGAGVAVFVTRGRSSPAVQPPAAVAASLATPTVATSFPVGQRPQAVLLSPDGRTAYVTNSASGTVSLIDTGTLATTASIPVTNGQPQFAGISPDGSRLYVSVDTTGPVDSVDVVDTASHAVTGTIAVGMRPFAPGVSPDGSRVLVPNHGTSNISVIDTKSLTVTATVPVKPAPHFVAFTADGSKAYVADHESNVVTVLDGHTDASLAVIPVGHSPHSLAVSPDQRSVYVVDYDQNAVSVIDVATDQVTGTIPVGANPQSVAFAPDGRHAYVVNDGGNTVSVIDTGTRAVVSTVPVGRSPTTIAVARDGRAAYVTNFDDNTVSVLHTG